MIKDPKKSKKDNVNKEVPNNEKVEKLQDVTVENADKEFTTNQGLKMAEDEFSLTAGDRGPTLMEDFHFREKITHFDHERIPERIVHARGTGAHGVFKLYESMEKFTKAKLFTDTSRETPVFVRFSTVAGSSGKHGTLEPPARSLRAIGALLESHLARCLRATPFSPVILG